MENPSQIPQENTDYLTLRKEWDKAHEALSDDEGLELMNITNKDSDEIQAYLTKNIEQLSEAAKHFLLTSLRIKNLKN